MQLMPLQTIYYLKAVVPECRIEHLMNTVTVLCIIDCGWCKIVSTQFATKCQVCCRAHMEAPEQGMIHSDGMNAWMA